MEAQRLTNEHGEDVGVYMGMSQYEAALEAQRELGEAKREAKEIAHTLQLLEALVLDIFDSLEDAESYERFLDNMKEHFLAHDDSPEKAEFLLEILEDIEAQRTLKAEIEQEDDFAPWPEAQRRIADERAASR